MGHLSLGESSKPQSYHKAHLFGRTCGGQESTCPQRRENKPTSEKVSRDHIFTSTTKSPTKTSNMKFLNV